MRADQEAVIDLMNENTRLRAALEPFTKFPVERGTPWAEENDPWPDERILTGYDRVYLTVGMVRAARRALRES
jgi:hypothetical protein